MHRTIPVQNLLYSYLFPKPTSNDPPNFSNHLARNLIPEIRVETARFYGSLDSIEARYPGLNYTHLPHIRRLSHFPHHVRLFRAIRHLGITDHEVLDLARWEGTLWARERYEQDEGIKVCDTTGDEVGRWIDPRKCIKAPGIRAVTTATPSTRARNASSPVRVPQTATACETDTHQPDGPIVESSANAFSEGSSRLQQEERDADMDESSANNELSTSHASARPRITTAESSRQLLDFVAQHRRNGHAEPLPELERVTQDLIDSWNALQAAHNLSDDDMVRFRQDIFERISQLQIDVPSSLNLASALMFYLEQRLQVQPGTPQAASRTDQVNRVVSPPAA